MEILVTGGRGALGRHVVRRLADAGQQVRLLSRRPRPAGAPPDVTWATGDLADPGAVRAAVAGVDVVVHCATNSLKPRVDLVGARVLAEAASRAAERPHVVCMGIVGSDRIPYSYYRAKVQVETILAESGLPVTVQRATQFHELFVTVTRMLSRSPIVPVPVGFRAQPIAAADVAERLAELALGAPLGRAPDLGGPKVRDMADLVKTALRRFGKRRLVVPLPLVGKVARGFRAGDNLAPGHTEGAHDVRRVSRPGRSGGMKVVRGGVGFLAVIETALGLWALLAPRSFYDTIPGVDLLPYNEHLMRDYGAMNLALALVTWVAFVRFDVFMARVALGAYAVFAVPHLIYHQTHLEGLTPGEVWFILVLLWIAVLLPLMLLVLTRQVAPQVAKSSVSPPSV